MYDNLPTNSKSQIDYKINNVTIKYRSVRTETDTFFRFENKTKREAMIWYDMTGQDSPKVLMYEIIYTLKTQIKIL